MTRTKVLSEVLSELWLTCDYQSRVGEEKRNDQLDELAVVVAARSEQEMKPENSERLGLPFHLINFSLQFNQIPSLSK